MNKIKTYFDGISHGKDPEQISEDIIRRADSTAKKHSFRTIAIAAAAAVVMVGGVTAAAATGLLDINDMFGGRISTQDEQLAQDLVGAAKDFKWTTSDDDYAIELKGVTGSESDMLLMYEIVRTDGRPVTDFMTNIPKDGELDMFTDISFSDNSPYTVTGSDMYFINEDGNVGIYYRIITNGNITGEHYSQKSVNLYPEKMLWDYLQHKDVWIMHMPREWSDRPIGFYNDEAFNDKIPLDIPLNDENIIGLELEWSIDFTYFPSDIAALSKSISEENADIEVSRWKVFTGGLETLDCNVIYSHFSCVGGWIEVEYAGEAYIGDNYESHNEVYLLMDNGEKHPCSFVGRGQSTFYEDEAVTRIDIEVRYGDTDDGTISAVDIDKIKAVYINGKTLPLA